MKAKYKIGMFVQFNSNDEQTTGVIDAVVTRAKGYSYLLDGREQEVTETNIIAAYRAVATRTKKTKTTTKVNAPKKKATHSQESTLAS